MSAPAITASSQSRTKLNAFKFIGSGGAPSENEFYGDNQEQENKSLTNSHKRKASQQRLQSSLDESRKTLNDVQAAFPATPVGRVPLAELISNGEDTFDQLPLLTPVERVLWNLSQSSMDIASNFATPFTTRGTKRARSSSLQSSPREDVASLLRSPGNKAPFNTQSLQRSLLSPHADPAKDLWSRYSLHPESNQTPSKPPALSLSNLLHTSSPQTPAKSVNRLDTSGLRRTLSCGMEWPTSAAKRRKIQKTLSQIGDHNMDISRDGTTRSCRDLKVSRVNFLLGKIHDGLAENQGVSIVARRPSSSPPALVQAQTMALASSPIEQSQGSPAHISSSDARTRPNTKIHTKLDKFRGDLEQFEPFKDEAMVMENKASSDYGDDDFDEGLLDEVDATIRITALADRIAENSIGETPLQLVEPQARTDNSFGPPTAHETSGTKLGISPRSSDLYSNKPLLLPIATVEKQPEHKLVSKMDEFDDEFDEFFGEGLVSLAAEFDRQIPLPAANDCFAVKLTAPNFPTETHLKADVLADKEGVVDLVSDDEFGAGFDFEDIAEDYARATQAANTSSASLVRGSHIQRLDSC